MTSMVSVGESWSHELSKLKGVRKLRPKKRKEFSTALSGSRVEAEMPRCLDCQPGVFCPLSWGWVVPVKLLSVDVWEGDCLMDCVETRFWGADGLRGAGYMGVCGSLYPLSHPPILHPPEI